MDWRQNVLWLIGQRGTLYAIDLTAWQLIDVLPASTLWTNIGAGSAARATFQRTAEVCRSASPEAPRRDRLLQSEAYATENRMLLSLSYDDFFEWAARLAHMSPDEPVLQEQVPIVRQAREGKQSWGDVMFWSANNYFDVDPCRDPGRYGCAASFFQLMLAKRRDLRLTRENHVATLISYSALLIKMWAVCGETQLRQFGRSDVSEFRFLLEPAFPVLDEFLERTLGHERVQECRRNVERCYQNGDESIPGHADGSVQDPSTNPHFRKALRDVAGPACVLRLQRLGGDGPNVVVQYSWQEPLSEEQADRGDTKARAFLNCAVGAAAAVAGLRCAIGPNPHSLTMPNGEPNPIPGWYLEDRHQPTYFVNSQFNAAARSVDLTIGTPQLLLHALGQHDDVSQRLAAAIQQLFTEFSV